MLTDLIYRLVKGSPLTNAEVDANFNKLDVGLGKVAVNFSGSTPPDNPAPYMTWADTGNGLRKERNAANSAWVILGPLLTEMATKSYVDASNVTFEKFDYKSPCFVKTAASTLSIKAGTSVVVGNTPIAFAADTPITMPSLSGGSDYSVWVNPDGTTQAVLDSFSAPASPPQTGSKCIGGFHYSLTAPGTTVAGGSFATTGNGMIWTQPDVDLIAGINTFSIWDLLYRPTCDPRGMYQLPGVSGGVWTDIYLTNTEHITYGTSAYNQAIASGSVFAKIPTQFGGNNTTKYASLTWWEANEIVRSQGKRLGRESEFVVSAYGVTENQSLGGASVTPPATLRQPGYTSRGGGEQMTGHIWTWGEDSSYYPSTSAPGFFNVNGGRGQIYMENSGGLIRVILGGNRASAAGSGSRASGWYGVPWGFNWGVGVRAFCDHMTLGVGAR